ncbi:helix-turn-helix transcriptional regulator [Lactococcus formosensis]|uniref:helix-turn-helix transcriptional regulator n=1 Tax=Lactococcus formosensis TaxID=1281486 RepID=UPI002435D898|nr:helix-turn-helix transcriptional regulator [Lactococcus formosensis]MDG6125139.1 helix-turn-helix transcriptional regulator [Lactococcus formosensis]MDG6148837.1 helix-turn-helix transcriptional regulator [Lactococcus formosensis]
MPENFKLTLAALRVNKGLNQAEMAKELDVHKNTWMNWESGKTFPDIPDLEKIEKYFGIKYQNINFHP